MKVSLVAITKPTIEGCETPEQFVAYCARVSNPANQSNHATGPKLLRYLMDNAHWSPLEMVHMVMEIETTRDIARQILRHRSFSFQEFSQRYADPTKDLGFVTREMRLQDPKNRQNSIEVNDSRILDSKTLRNSDWTREEWVKKQQAVIDAANEAYQWAVGYNIAKEQARAVLPEGLTESRLYMSGTLRSWVHYCELRMANGTQKEHMEIARACWDLCTDHFPMLKEMA